MYCLQHKLGICFRLHKCQSVHPFCLFSVQSCHFLPGDNLFSGCGIAAGQICVYDSIVRSNTEHGGKELQTMNHKTWPSGRGRLWTIPPSFPKKDSNTGTQSQIWWGQRGVLYMLSGKWCFVRRLLTTTTGPIWFETGSNWNTAKPVGQWGFMTGP